MSETNKAARLLSEFKAMLHRQAYKNAPAANVPTGTPLNGPFPGDNSKFGVMSTRGGKRRRKKELTTGTTVFKAADGTRHALLVSSNAYEDREDEIIKEKALAEYVEKSYRGDEYRGENVHLLWHGGEPIGDIIGAEMVGPFLVEVTRERPNAVINLAKDDEPPLYAEIKAVWDMLESAPVEWGASIGFRYRQGDKAGGAYDQIMKFETSSLPRDFAANSYTYSEVISDGRE
jgi:hypothetical protein